MTPVPADQCPHRCCVEDEVPHEHKIDPAHCVECKALDDPPKLRTQGSFLVDKAFRVAGKRHPNLDPKKEQ